MSFAALRQKVIQSHVLSKDRFGEDVTIESPDGPRTVRVKIEHEQLGPQARNRTVANSGNEQRQGTFDQRERIRVTVSRDAAWEFALPTRPLPATTLQRAEAVDADRRPFAFRGEVLFESDQQGVYVFERPLRFVQGKGM